MQSTFSSSTQSSFPTGQSIGAHSTDIGDTDTDNTYTMDGNGDENHKDQLYSSLSCASSSNPSAGTTQLPQDARCSALCIPRSRSAVQCICYSVAWMALAHSRFPVQTPSVSAQIACQRMDTELAAIEKLVLFSRRHRNTLAAISILPVEIMLVIIRLLKRDWRPSDGTPGGVYKTGLPKLPYQLGWMTVSHVCRHWRQSMDGHILRWSIIVLEHGDDPSIQDGP
ncbi:hypothetical protein OF83DRAFT_592342 [Amylostereum chailletii]|nr:hypothetical protein OF83DRAFT_592342 [Amylostereum chailletii]